MKKYLALALSVCMLMVCTVPAFAADADQSPNNQAVFEIGQDWINTITEYSSIALPRSLGSTATITAEQYMQFSIQNEVDPERKQRMTQALSMGAYTVEYDDGAFIVTIGDLEVYADDLARAWSKTKTVQQEKIVETPAPDYCRAVFVLKGSYKWGNNDQVIYIRADGAPTIRNTHTYDFGGPPWKFQDSRIKLGVASVSGGGQSQTAPLPALYFSAKPQYSYNGWRTVSMGITVYYEPR